MLTVEFDNRDVFLNRPFALDYIWVKVIVPPLATLLADASRQILGDLRPVSSAPLLDSES